MARKRKEIPNDPPQPPDTARRISLYRYQWVGMPLLALLPALAAAGLLGESSSTQHARSQSLDVTIDYPSRLRYNLTQRIAVRVENRGTLAIDTVHLVFDVPYMDAFANVNAVPSFTEAYEIPIVAVAPGEIRVAHIDVTGQKYWRQSGSLQVNAGSDRMRIPLSTVIFP
jgi:hypothetical protein